MINIIFLFSMLFSALGQDTLVFPSYMQNICSCSNPSSCSCSKAKNCPVGVFGARQDCERRQLTSAIWQGSCGGDNLRFDGRFSVSSSQGVPFIASTFSRRREMRNYLSCNATSGFPSSVLNGPFVAGNCSFPFSAGTFFGLVLECAGRNCTFSYDVGGSCSWSGPNGFVLFAYFGIVLGAGCLASSLLALMYVWSKADVRLMVQVIGGVGLTALLMISFFALFIATGVLPLYIFIPAHQTRVVSANIFYIVRANLWLVRMMDFISTSMFAWVLYDLVVPFHLGSIRLVRGLFLGFGLAFFLGVTIGLTIAATILLDQSGLTNHNILSVALTVTLSYQMLLYGVNFAISAGILIYSIRLGFDRYKDGSKVGISKLIFLSSALILSNLLWCIVGMYYWTRQLLRVRGMAPEGLEFPGLTLYLNFDYVWEGYLFYATACIIPYTVPQLVLLWYVVATSFRKSSKSKDSDTYESYILLMDAQNTGDPPKRYEDF